MKGVGNERPARTSRMKFDIKIMAKKRGKRQNQMYALNQNWVLKQGMLRRTTRIKMVYFFAKASALASIICNSCLAINLPLTTTALIFSVLVIS